MLYFFASPCFNFAIRKIRPSCPKAQASGQDGRKVAMGYSNRKKWLHPSPRPPAASLSPRRHRKAKRGRICGSAGKGKSFRLALQRNIA